MSQQYCFENEECNIDFCDEMEELPNCTKAAALIDCYDSTIRHTNKILQHDKGNVRDVDNFKAELLKLLNSKSKIMKPKSKRCGAKLNIDQMRKHKTGKVARAPQNILLDEEEKGDFEKAYERYMIRETIYIDNNRKRLKAKGVLTHTRLSSSMYRKFPSREILKALQEMGTQQ